MPTTLKCAKMVSDVLNSGQVIKLHGLRKRQLEIMGWDFAWEVNAEKLLLANRNGEIVLMQDVENSEPVLITKTFDEMGGIAGLLELIDATQFYKIVSDTPALRNIIYREMLDLYERYISQDNTDDVGFCYLIMQVSNYYGKSIFLEDLPELWAHRPQNHHNGYWFPTYTQDGINQRLNILREVIFETQYNTFA